MNNAVTNLGYVQEGNAATVLPEQNSNTVPLYRLYKTNEDHFYTASATQRDNAINNSGYKDEGVTAYIYASQICGSIPLYRMYQPTIVDHLYTVNETEKLEQTANTAAAWKSKFLEAQRKLWETQEEAAGLREKILEAVL